MSQTAAIESADAYCLRRRNELHAELAMCQYYVAASEPSKCAETAVGGAYIRRRNSRYAGLHDTRVSEMRQRAESAERQLAKLPLLYEYCFPIFGQCGKVCSKSLLF